MERKLAEDFEAALDEIFVAALKNDTLSIPGFVAMCRRGNSVYGPKAFGCSDLATSTPMPPDAVMRMYSMTKVLTSAIALMLYDKGLYQLDDPVGKHLPNFDRAWVVVGEADKNAPDFQGDLEVYNMALGRSSVVGYAATPAREPIRIKHLMTETSGIGYESWSDLDEILGHALDTKRSFQIANALRSQVNPTVYKSSCILGQDLDLAEFCDVIARAGVLATQPGRFSYGLGAAVLGRVIEVVYARHFGGPKKLSEIFEEMLFKPLKMRDAGFYLDEDDPRIGRIPTLYGVSVDDQQNTEIVLAENSVPPTTPPYSNGADHFAGPRKQESGDTGSIMTVEDYGKFLDFLCRGGVTEDGARLLSPMSVEALTGHWVSGLDLDSKLAHAVGLAGDANRTLPKSFQFGWAITRPGATLTEYSAQDHPGLCHWGGYARTSMHYYRGEDSWIVIAPQIICHRPAGAAAVTELLTEPAVALFQQLWR